MGESVALMIRPERSVCAATSYSRSDVENQPTEPHHCRRGLLIGLFFFLLKFFIFFAEPLDAAGGIDKLLFAGKKRMALGANFNSDILPGGPDLKYIS